jgi:Fur family ferric uptake transcriptional regulator
MPRMKTAAKRCIHRSQALSRTDLQPWLKQAGQLLRDGGLRSTQPRMAVLAALLEAGRPLTVSEILNRLAPSEINFTTVYRMVHVFVDEELARAVGTIRRGRRFEVQTPGSAPHPHLQCRRCELITCLKQGLLSGPEPAFPLVACGALIEKVELCLVGLCAECRAA